MDKHSLDAVEMLKIAAQHAYCAEHLLNQQAEVKLDEQLTIDALLPISSLMHMAFELTLKAFLLNDRRQIKQCKSLFDLIELNNELGFSKQELDLINTLARQQAFRKGTDCQLWKTREQHHIFCEQIMGLYEKLQKVMPLELQTDYQ